MLHDLVAHRSSSWSTQGRPRPSAQLIAPCRFESAYSGGSRRQHPRSRHDRSRLLAQPHRLVGPRARARPADRGVRRLRAGQRTRKRPRSSRSAATPGLWSMGTIFAAMLLVPGVVLLLLSLAIRRRTSGSAVVDGLAGVALLVPTAWGLAVNLYPPDKHTDEGRLLRPAQWEHVADLHLTAFVLMGAAGALLLLSACRRQARSPGALRRMTAAGARPAISIRSTRSRSRLRLAPSGRTREPCLHGPAVRCRRRSTSSYASTQPRLPRDRHRRRCLTDLGFGAGGRSAATCSMGWSGRVRRRALGHVQCPSDSDHAIAVPAPVGQHPQHDQDGDDHAHLGHQVPVHSSMIRRRAARDKPPGRAPHECDAVDVTCS